MTGDVPFKDFDQRARFYRRLNKGKGRRGWRWSGHEAGDRRQPLQSSCQVADRFGFAQDLDRKPRMKRTLDAQHQLGAAKTVDAEIMLETAGQGDIDGPFGLLAQLFYQLGDDGKKSLLARSLVGWLCQESCFHRVASSMTISAFSPVSVDRDQPRCCRVGVEGEAELGAESRMRPLLHASLVNGRFGDPALYIETLFEKHAILLDLGDIAALPPRKINRIEHVFVSHAHIDHFVGFDLLLRVLVGREKTVHLFGPEGFIDRVGHKLQAYQWNLVDRFLFDLVFAVAEIEANGVDPRRSFPA